MLLYKMNITQHSGETFGVSQQDYIEKYFESEQEFKEWEKRKKEYDYDGSYFDVHVISKEVVDKKVGENR